MKGHLDVKELEKYKKADLQKLAEELGVSTEGTIKELAERCAEVEVEIPDESELTEEEKEAAEQAAAEYAEENEQEEPEKDDEPQAAGTVTVEVTAMYLDRVLNEVHDIRMNCFPSSFSKYLVFKNLIPVPKTLLGSY